MSLRFLSRALPVLSLLPLVAGCSGSLDEGAEVGFMASGEIAVTHESARPATLVGHLRVGDDDVVEGTLAFTDGGSPVAVKGTLEGGRLHFADLVIGFGGATIAGSFSGTSSYHAAELDIVPRLADDGSIASVTITASGEVTDSGGDQVSTTDFSLDFKGGPDESAPEIVVFDEAQGLPRGPVDPIEILFSEPVATSAITASSITVTAAGQPIAVDIVPEGGAGELAVRATVKPRGHWPFDADLTLAPAGALADMNGNAWTKGVDARGSTAADGALTPTTFEDETTTAFMTPVGPAAIAPLPPLLAFQEQERAMLVPATGAWARVDLPADAKEIRMRVAYVLTGFGGLSQPDWVLEQLGWSIHVAGDDGQIVESRDMVEASFKELTEGPIPQTVGPIEVVTLDVHELAGTSVVLALRPRSFHTPPVGIDGMLAVDWIEF